MTLQIRGWETWQGAAVKRLAGRRAPGSRKPLTLAFLSISSDLTLDHRGAPDPAFQKFAAEVGGRNAETYWIRILQYVATHDPMHGTLRGVDRGRMGDLVLGRAWDRVHTRVGARTYDALVNSGLATVSGRQVGSNLETNSCQSGDPGLGLGLGRESESAVDSDSVPPPAPGTSTTVSAEDPPEATATAPEGPASSTSSPAPDCPNCDENGTPHGRKFGCCSCPRGSLKKFHIAKGVAAEREQRDRARKAAAARSAYDPLGEA